jgi:hypothetical protein
MLLNSMAGRRRGCQAVRALAAEGRPIGSSEDHATHREHRGHLSKRRSRGPVRNDAKTKEIAQTSGKKVKGSAGAPPRLGKDEAIEALIAGPEVAKAAGLLELFRYA